MLYPTTNSYYPKNWIVRYKLVPGTVEKITIQFFWIVTMPKFFFCRMVYSINITPNANCVLSNITNTMLMMHVSIVNVNFMQNNFFE